MEKSGKRLNFGLTVDRQHDYPPLTMSLDLIACAPQPLSLLAPVSRRTLADDVLVTLRKAIISGAFAPGDHVAEGSLAQQLAVSRAPVREAMIQLEREGLLEFDRRGAAFVKKFTDDDFEEIFTLRLALEMMAARLVCRSWEQVPMDLIHANLEQTKNAAQVLEITLLDVEFHSLLVHSARHSRLSASWSNLRHQIELWLARMHSRVAASLEKTREDTVTNHTALLEDLRSGPERSAEIAMREHIEGWRLQYPRAVSANRDETKL